MATLIALGVASNVVSGTRIPNQRPFWTEDYVRNVTPKKRRFQEIQNMYPPETNSKRPKKCAIPKGNDRLKRSSSNHRNVQVRKLCYFQGFVYLPGKKNLETTKKHKQKGRTWRSRLRPWPSNLHILNPGDPTDSLTRGYAYSPEN